MTHEDLAHWVVWVEVAGFLASVALIVVAVIVSVRMNERRRARHAADAAKQLHDESGRVRDEVHGAHLGALRAAQEASHAASVVERLTKRQGSDPGRKE